MRLYSTLHREKVELPPPPGPIGIYTCGPTVYQRIHVGNGRPFALSMWLRSWLLEQGYDVTLVENITDINDRIYAAAPGASAELAANATEWHREDTDLLGLGRPDAEPKATETIPEIVAMIEELIASGHAYEAGGDVYFRVAGFPDYGALSGQRPDQVQEDEDEEPSPLKEDRRDFALWKANKPDEDTWWDSPWGRGRPGWHIECSAMAEKFLGPAFEIHVAGLDLVFPHNENERAQSRALGREFARLWLHNGMLAFTGEKMSKSLGNVVTLRDAVERWGRHTILLYFLGGHWRKPIDFDDEVMAQARAQWQDFVGAVYDAPAERPAPGWQAFVDALEDDFNTPDALAVLHEWKAAGQIELLRRGLRVFGLEIERVEPPRDVYEVALDRLSARRGGDFGRADELREDLAARGWEVRDKPDGFALVPLQ
jgi:cysteinyl-tRNA synthetase